MLGEMLIGASSSELLAIPEKDARRLFPDPTRIHEHYKALARRWHPDTSLDPRAGEVFVWICHLKELVESASPRSLVLHCKNNHALNIQYLRQTSCDLGDTWICKNSLVFRVDSENQDLADRALGIHAGLSFANRQMAQEFQGAVPQLKSSYLLSDGAKLYVFKKNHNWIRLRDLLEALDGALDPRHSAWILGSLLNLACYLEFQQIVHLDLSLESLWIEPVQHRVALLGGWWFATVQGHLMKGLPARCMGILPPELLLSRKADFRADLELIRAIGRDLLVGEPEALIQWAWEPAGSSARVEYRRWMEEVLPAAFGPRRYMELSIRAAEVYGF